MLTPRERAPWNAGPWGSRLAGQASTWTVMTSGWSSQANMVSRDLGASPPHPSSPL